MKEAEELTLLDQSTTVIHKTKEARWLYLNTSKIEKNKHIFIVKASQFEDCERDRFYGNNDKEYIDSLTKREIEAEIREAEVNALQDKLLYIVFIASGNEDDIPHNDLSEFLQFEYNCELYFDERFIRCSLSVEILQSINSVEDIINKYPMFGNNETGHIAALKKLIKILKQTT